MSQPPIPVVARVRTFPAVPPRRVDTGAPFPRRVIVADDVVGPVGIATCGAYVGDGPDLLDVGGRFLGRDAPPGLLPQGRGPLRDLDDFLDRVLWRPVYESRFGFVSWDPAAFFSSLAYTVRKNGAWAVIFTDPNPAGGRWIDYYRSPIVFEPKNNGRVDVRFGPRKDPDARDFDENGRQYAGRFLPLRDTTSALAGERPNS